MRTSWVVLPLLALACHGPAPSRTVPDASLAAAPRAPEHRAAPTAPHEIDAKPAKKGPSLSVERLSMLRHHLCLTEGQFSGSEQLAVKSAKLRCVQADSAGDRARLRFRYEGASAERTPLKSGAVREQIGLKLRARDSCNLLYVMWRFLPEASVVVSFKDNPDDSTHGECENRGYTNLRPAEKIAPPAVELGAEYELRAEIKGETLEAWINDRLVWQGALPAGALKLEGPAGMRSDNVQWTLLDFDGGEPSTMRAPSAAPSNCRHPG